MAEMEPWDNELRAGIDELDEESDGRRRELEEDFLFRDVCWRELREGFFVREEC